MAADLQAVVIAVTTPVLAPWAVAAALRGPIFEVRAAAAALTLFANTAAEASSPARIPALLTIAVAEPVSQLGIVAVMRNHVPAEGRDTPPLTPRAVIFVIKDNLLFRLGTAAEKQLIFSCAVTNLDVVCACTDFD